MLLDLIITATLAISTFNGLACLWLGVSVVLLNWRPASSAPDAGNQSRLLAALAVAVLMLSALFFLAHSALIGRGVLLSGVGAEFWWRVAWVPVVLVPYGWYALSVFYSGAAALRRHRLPLAALGLAATLIAATAQLGGLPSYRQALRYELNEPLVLGVPLLIWAYLPLLLLCALLPIDALLHGLNEPDQRSVARRRARPALIVTSLLLLLSGLLVGVGALWVADARLELPLLPFGEVMLLDLIICALVGVATLVVGSAVVSYEVFTGGALPRRGFLQRWVGTVVVLMGSALLTAVLSWLDLRPIYGLLTATAVATAAYALLGWQNDRIRATFMARLRPFVTGVTPRSGPMLPGSESWQPLFIALCQDVLTTPRACLLQRFAGEAQVALRYGWQGELPDAEQVLEELGDQGSGFGVQGSGDQQIELHPRPLNPEPRTLIPEPQPPTPKLLNGQRYQVAWVLPLGGNPAAGALLFDGRGRGGIYSEEEIDLAQACCERIMDALASARLTDVAVGLLQQRIAEVKVLGARQRRVLHDEVLPGIHAALIHLGGARSDSSGTLLAPEAAAAISAALSDAHRRMADLIHAIPPASPHRLDQQGLAAALEAMLRRDFAQGFEQACWQADPRAAEAAGQLAPFAAEVLFYAAQEAVRNAARHGRGSASDRPLRLDMHLAWAEGLQLSVADDGVGLAERSLNTGSGSGLQFHQAMLAVIGGALQIEPRTGGGTLVRLFLPADRLV